MTRLPLLLLVPLAFALGLAAGRITKSPGHAAHSPASAATTSASTAQSSQQDLRAAFWRHRFLVILDEPSAALRMSAYYALPQEIPLAEYPVVMEAIYPEGWARYRGDLPLALSMEWIRQGSPRFGETFERLITLYPELWDNFEGVFFNLGLLNAPGSIPAIQSFQNPDTRSRVAKHFIDGIEDKDTSLLFPSRLALLGPKETYANLSPAELDQAIATFWTDPNNLLQQGVKPTNPFWITLGKRYGTDCLTKIDSKTDRAPLLSGILATSPALPPELRQAIVENWWPNYELEQFLSETEAYNVLRLLNEIKEITPKLANNSMAQIWQKGLTRDLADTLLARDDLPVRLRSIILNNAANLYQPHEFLELLAASDSPKLGLNALLDNLSEEERILMIESVPQDWFDPTIISTNLYAFTRSNNSAGIQALINRFGNLGPYLPHNPDFAKRLWAFDPELYLTSIASLDLATQGQHLSIIAQRAQEEELPSLLENSSLEQQTNVLIDLISSKPALAVEILKSESPDAFDTNQSVQIGNQLAYRDDKELALAYFQSRQLENRNDQISLLTYCLRRIDSGADLQENAPIGQSSAQHDFIVRAAQAFRENTTDPANLESLQRENPDAFATGLATAIRSNLDGSLSQKAAKLLTSPNLTAAQRRQIHQALYGDDDQ